MFLADWDWADEEGLAGGTGIGIPKQSRRSRGPDRRSPDGLMMDAQMRTALRRVAVVVPKHSAEPFPALYFAGSPADLIIRVDNSILQSLMIPFLMVMGGEVFQSSFQRLPAKEDHPVEALGFDGSHVSFEIGVQIWAPRRQKDDFGVGQVVNVCAERQELGVPVNDQAPSVCGRCSPISRR